MSQAPTPVPAATILMLRDGVDALEVFMVVRHHQIDFASGAARSTPATVRCEAAASVSTRPTILAWRCK